VQSAREAARRMQCTNKLKQMALAAHNIHDAKGAFPSGHRVTYNGSAQVYFANWGIQLLPYLEQQALFGLLRRHGAQPTRRTRSSASRKSMSCLPCGTAAGAAVDPRGMPTAALATRNSCLRRIEAWRA
jgi:hypothetical protein